MATSAMSRCGCCLHHSDTAAAEHGGIGHRICGKTTPKNTFTDSRIIHAETCEQLLWDFATFLIDVACVNHACGLNNRCLLACLAYKRSRMRGACAVSL